MDTEENKKIALRFLANMSARNAEGVLGLIADNATWWLSGQPDKLPLAGTMTKAKLAEIVKLLFAALPNEWRLTPTGITAEGDRVAVEVEGYGVTAKGKVYDNRYHLLFEIREGKIQAGREYCDTMLVKEVMEELMTP